MTTHITTTSGRDVTTEGSPGSIGRRYRVDPTAWQRRDHIAYRAVRRGDDHPVWILVPQWRHAGRFTNAVTLIRSARQSMRLRHPGIVKTVDVGLLPDGRPYVVVARPPATPLAAVAAHAGPLPWPAVRGIAMRLCGALEAARRLGLAPRTLDLESCVLVDDTTDDVRVGGLFVPATSRLPETDPPAIAMIVHTLLGPATRSAAVDNLLLRAMGSVGYASVRDLQVALAAIDDGGCRESHGANHAEVVGEFSFDPEPARAEAHERADAPRTARPTAQESAGSSWHDS